MRCTGVPANIGPVELSQHFVAFGKIVDMRIRNVTTEGGTRGQKEALIQFAIPRQAQSCVSVSELGRIFLFSFACPLRRSFSVRFFGRFVFSSIAAVAVVGYFVWCVSRVETIRELRQRMGKPKPAACREISVQYDILSTFFYIPGGRREQSDKFQSFWRIGPGNAFSPSCRSSVSEWWFLVLNFDNAVAVLYGPPLASPYSLFC